MADDQRFRPVPRGGHVLAEGARARGDILRRFVDVGPPFMVDSGKIVIGPGRRQPVPVRADIAGQSKAFAHDGLDFDFQTQTARDRFRGLQGAAVGGRDDAGDSFVREAFGGLLGLMMAVFGQTRIFDSRIDPSGRLTQVEFALTVAEQDHAFGYLNPPMVCPVSAASTAVSTSEGRPNALRCAINADASAAFSGLWPLSGRRS